MEMLKLQKIKTEIKLQNIPQAILDYMGIKKLESMNEDSLIEK